jgi:hypothetical protein
MRAGFIEAADSLREAKERQEFWETQLKTLGFTHHHAKVYLVEHEENARGKSYSYWAVFAEEIKKP